MISMQVTWGKAKTIMKFLWRHFFTTWCLIEATHAFIYANPILSRVLITLCIAVAIDWAKQFIKPGRNFETPSSINYPNNIATPLHKRQWWNPELLNRVQ